MKKIIQGLEPPSLWHHFYQISQIPRCSKNEAQVREYVQRAATDMGLTFKADKTGNVVVKSPASAGAEEGPTVVLQSHLDMVCEKNKDAEHDFSAEGIRLKRDDDWVAAEGTTLGADNGVGVAAALAVMESREIKHGPLEFLFTVDEETGLTGAMELARHMLEGRLLINMDTEEDGAIYIGCAGGKDTELIVPVETCNAPGGCNPLRLRLGGLQGGHSGIDIHRGRGNAIRLLSRFLWKHQATLGLHLVGIQGGTKHNAIPRECEAITFVPKEKRAEVEKAVAWYNGILQAEFRLNNPRVFLAIDNNGFNAPDYAISSPGQHRLLNLLYTMPQGVLAMSQAVPDLVQTSTNLAIVETDATRARIVTSQRSSIQSQLEDASDMIGALGQQAGAQVRKGTAYPGWNPNPDSPLLKVAQSVFRSLFGNDPQVKAVHAGLECGIIGDKFPGMDMISFGPTIMGAHSPYERVQISTVKRFWDFLVALMERLAG